MCTTGEIIILSDDDDDCEDVSPNELSVFIVEVEDVKKSECAVPPTALDEDLVITFSRSAEVLPHARYDCPIHPFTATDCEVSVPVPNNHLMCDQCFCYICDKLASSCKWWCYSGLCHCNSHKKSEFWNNHRNCALLGGLKTFNLTLSEVDSHLRNAETMLQSFRQELSTLYHVFLKGRVLEECGPSQSRKNCRIFDYTPVYEYVSSFLNKADQQDSRAAAIMMLGATEDFIRHFQVSGTFLLQSPTADAAKARLLLLQRVIMSMQRQMVMADFPIGFRTKLHDFYKRLYFPTELKSVKNSLNVRPWDDVLLVSVLKGQNVTGFRKDKGKKDFLVEQISVVLLRTELLQRQHRYKELCRYLRVVETDNPLLFHQVQDLIPFFTCMMGDLPSALGSLLPTVNAPASRFTPQLFLFYLLVFQTATAPKLVVLQSSELSFDTAWEPIKDAVPLTCVTLVRFALRVHRCCPAVYADPQCWASLINVANTPKALQGPSPKFLLEAMGFVSSTLQDEYGSNIQIPRFFMEEYPDQALLLLVTGALCLRILDAPLNPAFPVLNAFKENVWALSWLRGTLSSSPERFNSFLLAFSEETENLTGLSSHHWFHLRIDQPDS
ncbi:uncharacterized protein [Pseudochaenichthys georgianus]|uniref:uncharacterized protein n=1 Tax=Pseudochaenichthys georgianus TaxID=52239 RepID=UPI00146C9481|nr:uncharacterized protein zgc:112980 [Pseudochaenichthys georgianus]